MPLTFFFCLALLVGLRLVHDDRDRTAVALGLVIGVGLLVKYTMVLVFPVLLALAWTAGAPRRVLRHGPVVLAISAAMLLAWLDHAFALGILTAQQEHLGKLAGVSWRHPRWALDAIFSKTPSALGVYTLPWIALGAWAARRRLREDGFVLAWIALVFVPLVATLPDNRYFLPAFPALLLLAARALLDRPARWTVHVLLLAWLLCAITLALYAQVDLSQRAFLFQRGDP
jgi:4-amino-4-deoxy-L-arabinose transferase-like glycosyltransferase